MTDPPYGVEHLPLWSDLAKFARRVLAPGRLLVAYAGKYELDKVIAALAEHLTWCWCAAVFLPDKHVSIRSRMIWSRWRPALMFSNGPYTPRSWVLDTVTATGNGSKEVTSHHWEQAPGPFAHWVKQATKPGELVVDPFTGGGTTGLACLATGRRFIGCDVDGGAVSLAVERLRAAARANEEAAT